MVSGPGLALLGEPGDAGAKPSVYEYDVSSKTRSTNVTPYNADDPSNQRVFWHKIDAYLDKDKGRLLAAKQGVLSFVDWKTREGISAAEGEERDERVTRAATAQDSEVNERYEAYLVTIKLLLRDVYNIFVGWPGACDGVMMEAIEHREKTMLPGPGRVTEDDLSSLRDGNWLYKMSRERDSNLTAAKQDEVSTVLATIRAAAYDESMEPIEGTLSSSAFYEDVRDFIEHYWFVWGMAIANDTSQPVTFFRVLLRILMKVTKIKTQTDGFLMRLDEATELKNGRIKNGRILAMQSDKQVHDERFFF